MNYKYATSDGKVMVYPDSLWPNGTTESTGVLIDPLTEEVIFNYSYINGKRQCFGYTIIKKNIKNEQK